MSMMITELYDALRQPPDEERARVAATAVAAFESRMQSMERKIDVLVWAVSTNVAISLGLLFLAMRHA